MNQTGETYRRGTGVGVRAAARPVQAVRRGGAEPVIARGGIGAGQRRCPS